MIKMAEFAFQVSKCNNFSKLFITNSDILQEYFKVEFYGTSSSIQKSQIVEALLKCNRVIKSLHILYKNVHVYLYIFFSFHDSGRKLFKVSTKPPLRN